MKLFFLLKYPWAAVWGQIGADRDVTVEKIRSDFHAFEYEFFCVDWSPALQILKKWTKFYSNSFILQKIFFINIFINPLTTGMDHFWSTCFLTPRLSAWPLHKIRNVTNVKFKSLTLVFNFKFDHKLFSSLKIT